MVSQNNYGFFSRGRENSAHSSAQDHLTPARCGGCGERGGHDARPRLQAGAPLKRGWAGLPHLLRGMKVADVVVILGSIDVIMGSVDR